MRHRLWAGLLLLVTVGCGGDSTSPDQATPTAGPDLEIRDGARGGNRHFYFLPPTVPAPAYSGVFDPLLAPTVTICELVNAQCGVERARFTPSSKPAITIDSLAQSYSVPWSTKGASAAKVYRIQVLVNGLALGHADAKIAMTKKELNAVGPDYAGVLSGKTLVVAFRIETGIVASVAVAPASATLHVGQESQLAATLLDLHGGGLELPVAWSSSGPATASVNETGLVSALAPGEVVLTAAAEGMSGTAVLSIVPAPVVSVTVSASSSDAMGIGATRQFTASVADAYGNVLTGRELIWGTVDPSVAAVDASGLVTAVAAGSTEVTATSEGVMGSLAVSVAAEVSLSCLKPFALPDLWSDADQDLDGDRLWDTGEAWTFDPTSGDYYLAYDPTQPDESSTGLGSSFRDLSGTVADRGRQLQMLMPSSTQPLTTYFFFPWIIPPSPSSALAYRDNITTCRADEVSLGTDYLRQAGNVVGVTVQGVNSLIAQDPGAAWNSVTEAVEGSAYARWEDSPRVVRVPIFDPSQIQVAQAAIQFNRVARVFIEQVLTNGTVIVRFMDIVK
jgi:uncharacterized protein YjdB